MVLSERDSIRYVGSHGTRVPRPKDREHAHSCSHSSTLVKEFRVSSEYSSMLSSPFLHNGDVFGEFEKGFAIHCRPTRAALQQIDEGTPRFLGSILPSLLVHKEGMHRL